MPIRDLKWPKRRSRPDVEKTALEFLDAGDAETALRILMTLLEECHDVFEYVDNSDGYLGNYFNGLGATLAEVILSLDLDDEQRKELLSDLKKLDSNLSGYGVDGLEVAVAAAKTGWGEGPREAQDRSVEEDDDEESDEEDDEESFVSGGYQPWKPESLS